MHSAVVRPAVLTGILVGLVMPAAAQAGPVRLTVPDAPVEVIASVFCNDVIVPGKSSCSVSVTWSPGAHDGGSPVTAFTVTGAESGQRSTLHVSGEAASTYTIGWAGATSDLGVSESSFTVTATNASGTSSPTISALEVHCFCPLPQPRVRVTTRNNGPMNDVLTFYFRRERRAKVAVRINDKPHVLRVKHARATLTVPDTNGRGPTIYTVGYRDLTQSVVAN